MKIKKGKVATSRKPLATLTEDERIEYQNRYNLMINKQMELMSISNYVDQYQNTLIEKYGLPNQFDLTLATGEIFKREEDNAQNGSV